MVRQALSLAALLLFVAGCEPSSSIAPVDRAAADVRVGKWDRAIEESTEAIRIDPRDARAYLIRGRAYHCRNKPGDLNQAIVDFSESIGIDPTQAEAYYSRSLAYRDQGDREKSDEDDKAARTRDGRVKDTYAHLPETTPSGPIADPIEEVSTIDKEPESVLDPLKNEGLPFGSRRLRDEEAEYQRLKLKFEEGNAGSPHEAPATTPRVAPPAAATPAPRGESPTSAGASAAPRSPLSEPDPALKHQSAMERLRANSERAWSDPRLSSPTLSAIPGPPTSYQPRYNSGAYTAAPASPFPQLRPRPTGYVEEQVQGPFRTQPRQYYNSNTANNGGVPYSVPTNHPIEAYHEDFNP